MPEEASTVESVEVSGLYFRQLSAQHSPFWHQPLPIEPQRQEAQRYNRATTEDYTQYLASSPEAAWAEQLRQAEIREVEDFLAVRRTLYAAWIEETEIADLSTLNKAEAFQPGLGNALVMDTSEDLAMAQDAAELLRAEGKRGLLAPSAALPGDLTLALFGPRSEHLMQEMPTSGEGWKASSRIQTAALANGRPPFQSLLNRVRHIGDPYPDVEDSE